MSNKIKLASGGPFLEVSFLYFLHTDYNSAIENILSELKSLNVKVDFAISDNELDQKIKEFVIGYPDEHSDPNTFFYHATEIPIFIETDGHRKASLHIRQVSQTLLAVDLLFFGSTHDAPEWNQRGITDDQLPIFKTLLDNLYDKFHFPLGSVGYESFVTDLFDVSEGWPSEKYIPENFRLKGDFVYIISDKLYVDLAASQSVTISVRNNR